jgi:hypothetical protein
MQEKGDQLRVSKGLVAAILRQESQSPRPAPAADQPAGVFWNSLGHRLHDH